MAGKGASVQPKHRDRATNTKNRTKKPQAGETATGGVCSA